MHCGVVNFKYSTRFSFWIGNYNGDAKDDNLKPNGSIAGDSTELGESWLVAENNTMYVQKDANQGVFTTKALGKLAAHSSAGRPSRAPPPRLLLGLSTTILSRTPKSPLPS